MQLRTAALVGVLGLGLGWAAGSRTPAAPPDLSPGGRSAGGPRPLGVGSAPPRAFTEELRLKLENQPKAPHPSRNPFVFGNRSSAVAAPHKAPPAAEPAPTADPVDNEPEPPRPGSQFRLAGMASTEGPDGPEFTAMIHDGRSLLFVKRGDVLPGGFVVASVDDSSVTLRDEAGCERTLRLR